MNITVVQGIMRAEDEATEEAIIELSEKICYLLMDHNRQVAWAALQYSIARLWLHKTGTVDYTNALETWQTYSSGILAMIKEYLDEGLESHIN